MIEVCQPMQHKIDATVEALLKSIVALELVDYRDSLIARFNTATFTEIDLSNLPSIRVRFAHPIEMYADDTIYLCNSDGQRLVKTRGESIDIGLPYRCGIPSHSGWFPTTPLTELNIEVA